MAFEVIFASRLFNLLIHSRIVKGCYEISVTASMHRDGLRTSAPERSEASSSDEDCHLQGRGGTAAPSQNALGTDAIERLSGGQERAAPIKHICTLHLPSPKHCTSRWGYSSDPNNYGFAPMELTV